MRRCQLLAQPPSWIATPCHLSMSIQHCIISKNVFPVPRHQRNGKRNRSKAALILNLSIRGDGPTSCSRHFNSGESLPYPFSSSDTWVKPSVVTKRTKVKRCTPIQRPNMFFAVLRTLLAFLKFIC